jgi:hypothetical protein
MNVRYEFSQHWQRRELPNGLWHCAVLQKFTDVWEERSAEALGLANLSALMMEAIHISEKCVNWTCTVLYSDTPRRWCFYISELSCAWSAASFLLMSNYCPFQLCSVHIVRFFFSKKTHCISAQSLLLQNFGKILYVAPITVNLATPVIYYSTCNISKQCFEGSWSERVSVWPCTLWNSSLRCRTPVIFHFYISVHTFINPWLKCAVYTRFSQCCSYHMLRLPFLKVVEINPFKN